MKGQMTIIGLIFVVVTLFSYFAVLPAIKTVLNDSWSSMTTTEQMLAGFIPVAVLLSVLVSIFAYSQPQYEQRR